MVMFLLLYDEYFICSNIQIYSHNFKEVIVSLNILKKYYFPVSKLRKLDNIVFLTLYGPNSFFRRFSGHNLR